jgi:hypothetical protein
MISFLGRYSKHDWREIVGGEQSKDAGELVEFLKSADGNSGPVVFRKPRWLAFQSQLVSTDAYGSENVAEATRYYDNVGASRFVVSRVFHDEPERALALWVEQSGKKLTKGFENDSFTVYELQ